MTGFCLNLSTQDRPVFPLTNGLIIMLLVFVGMAIGMIAARRWGAVCLFIIALAMLVCGIEDGIRNWRWDTLHISILIALLPPMIPVIIACGAWKNIKW